MPLRFVRSKVSTGNVLSVAIATTTIAQQLTTLVQFPPASAAVSVLLLIFETIQSIQTNKEGCLRLARRAARILLDINDQMESRWDSAPPLLLKNLGKFQDTLTEIYDFMKAEAQSKWSSRLLKKTSIEHSLVEFNTALDDASRSFQIATLIDIHCAVSPQKTTEKGEPSLAGKAAEVNCPEEEPSSPPYATTDTEKSYNPSSDEVIPPPQELEYALVARTPDDYLLSGTLASSSLDDDHGFRRYHQSEIQLRSRSRLNDGWWAGAVEVQSDGRKSLMKRYDGPREQALRHWLRDVKVLSNIYHESMPQMIGFSDDRSPTPFILLRNVQTKSPQSLLLTTLRCSTLASSLALVLRFYRDMSDAVSYTQRQLGLSDEQMQDFVQDARFRLNDEKTLVVGLPPPKDGQCLSWRNYNLTYSLVRACLTMLPNNGMEFRCNDIDETEEMRQKVNHLVTLARTILSSEDNTPTLSVRSQKLLDREDDGLPLTLSDIRSSSIHTRSHNHMWSERPVEPDKFAIGDLGYVPRGKSFGSFVKLCNILKDELISFCLNEKAFGNSWCWNSFPMKRERTDCYELPFGVKGWPVAVPSQTQIDSQIIHEASISCVSEAWAFLLKHGKTLASKFSIEPQDLILVTRAGTDQSFHIRQFGHIPGQFSFPQHLGYGKAQFTMQNTGSSFQMQQNRTGFPNQVMLPAIFYLFTSINPEYEPYYSQTPVCVPIGAPRPQLCSGYISRIGCKYGFMNYVQLHAEDFST